MAQNEEKGERVISFEELKKLVNSPGWKRSQNFGIFDGLPYVLGWAGKINKLDGVEIIYVEEWLYDESHPVSFNPLHWIVNGVRVVHDDGEEVDSRDLADVLPKEFTTIDYSEFIPFEQKT